jgi:ribosomal protein L22
MATMSWDSDRVEVREAMVRPVRSRPQGMREVMDAVRDTLAVLAIQIVFRAMLFLRRWNY